MRLISPSPWELCRELGAQQQRWVFGAPQGPAPSAWRPNSSLPSYGKEFPPPPESGWAGEGGCICKRDACLFCQLFAAQCVHLQRRFGCLVCWGDQESFGERRGQHGLRGALCHVRTPRFSRLHLPCGARDRAVPAMMLPPGMAPWVHSCIHPHAPRLLEFSLRRWGHASHFLARGRAQFLWLLRFPGLGESGRAGAACLTGASLEASGPCRRALGGPDAVSPSGDARPTAFGG